MNPDNIRTIQQMNAEGTKQTQTTEDTSVHFPGKEYRLTDVQNDPEVTSKANTGQNVHQKTSQTAGNTHAISEPGSGMH